jgi:hypothetical protein
MIWLTNQIGFDSFEFWIGSVGSNASSFIIFEDDPVILTVITQDIYGFKGCGYQCECNGGPMTPEPITSTSSLINYLITPDVNAPLLCAELIPEAFVIHTRNAEAKRQELNHLTSLPKLRE